MDSSSCRVQCPVTVKNIKDNNHDSYLAHVQSFEFHEFDELKEFMDARKDGIEKCDPTTLNEIQAQFLIVVDSIIANHGLFPLASSCTLRPYTLPSVRTKEPDGSFSTFASYLHNDAWYDANDINVPFGMINVWFILNQDPPTNHLVFHRTQKSAVRQTHMLHGTISGVSNKDVVYDKNASWGKFYCFVSGQRNDSDDVLLHGAMDILDSDSVAKERRRSCEMRFTLHAPNVNSSTTKEEDTSSLSQSSAAAACTSCSGMTTEEEEDDVVSDIEDSMRGLFG